MAAHKGAANHASGRYYFDDSLFTRTRRSLTRLCDLVIFGVERRRVDGRVESFSLPLDHGFTVLVPGVFRSLDISVAQKHVGGGLIRIRLREPFGQCE